MLERKKTTMRERRFIVSFVCEFRFIEHDLIRESDIRLVRGKKCSGSDRFELDVSVFEQMRSNFPVMHILGIDRCPYEPLRRQERVFVQ